MLHRLAAFVLGVLLFASPGLAATNINKPADASKPTASGKDAPDGPVSTEGAAAELPGRLIIAPSSFHGVMWGAPLSSIKGMAPVAESGPVTYATVKGAVYRIGDVFIDSVVYAFCKDRFSAVRLEFTGRDKFDQIRDVISGKYSEPLKAEGPGEQYGLPLGDVLIMMEFNPETDKGALGYSYLPIFNECAPKLQEDG